MPETKDQIAARADALTADNERLRAQLAAGGQAAGAYRPAHFFLSEGERQELALYGVATIGGQRLSVEQVREKLAGTNQASIEIGEPAPGLDRRADPTWTAPPGAVRGVDFVYPSVAPGLIDPAVAGTPGIHGPVADGQLVDAELTDDDDLDE